MRTLVSLADALRAAHELGPLDESAREVLLKALGVTAGGSPAPPPSIGVWKPSSTEALGRVGASVPNKIVAPSPARENAPRTGRVKDGGKGRTVVTLVKRDPEERPPVPSWLTEQGNEMAAPAGEHGLSPVPEPLFGRRTGRAILTTLSATVVREGAIDMDNVVQILGNGRHLERLPRLATATLRRGADLLVDLAAAMDPFRADIEQLLAAVGKVLSFGLLSVSYFSGSPARTSTIDGTRQSRRPWSGSTPRRPVVVVTDLGIGGPPLDREGASIGEWLAFARQVRACGQALLAMVPYEARRWPPVLQRAMTILHWSERTTVGEIRRALREAQHG